MDRATYRRRSKELRRQKIGAWVGMLFGLATSWLGIGLVVMYVCMKRMDSIDEERDELEREFEQYEMEQSSGTGASA